MRIAPEVMASVSGNTAQRGLTPQNNASTETSHFD